MESIQLPESFSIGQSCIPEELAGLLDLVVPGHNFTHMTIITGRSYSGRILFTGKTLEEAVPFHRPFSSMVMAKELLRLAEKEARYDLTENHSDRKKGIGVFSAKMYGEPVVIVWAKWV